MRLSDVQARRGEKGTTRGENSANGAQKLHMAKTSPSSDMIQLRNYFAKYTGVENEFIS